MVSFTWFLWLPLYASTRALACSSSGARVHSVSAEPSSTPSTPAAAGGAAVPLSSPPPHAASAVMVNVATAIPAIARRMLLDMSSRMLPSETHHKGFGPFRSRRHPKYSHEQLGCLPGEYAEDRKGFQERNT